MIRIEIPGRFPSLNDFYEAKHWSVRKRMADEWHETIGWCLKEQWPKGVKLTPPVMIDVTRFAVRPPDCDNAVMAPKFFCDALVAGGYLKDDGPEYIEALLIRSKKGTEEKTVFTIQ